MNTTIKEKKKNYKKFVQLIENQFNHWGDKYKWTEDKEYTDMICEAFPGESGVDWILWTCMKYLWRYKNFGREKDLLKIATYIYLIWLKCEHHLKDEHDEDIKR